MKKKLLIVLMLIIIVAPSYVKANVVPKEVDPYKVITIKDSEATCGEEEITIKKGEVLEVTYEIFDEDSLIFKYGKKECEILMEDVKLQTKEFDISKVKDKIKFKNETGISYSSFEMKYGPSIMYETMQKIPNETKINILGTYDGWYYIEYNNKKGWINDLLVKFEEDYINPRTQSIYSDQIAEKEIGIIPAGVKIKSMYSTESSDEYNLSYITYNGVTGYVLYNLFKKIGKDITLDMDGRMYEEANTDSKVLISKIKEGTKVHVDYGVIKDQNVQEKINTWYYTNYNGKTGWILLGTYFDDYEDDNYKDKINVNSIIFETTNIKINENLNVKLDINNNSDLKIEKILLVFKNKNNENKLVYLNDINTSPYIEINNKLFESGEYNLEYVRLEMNDTAETKILYRTTDIKNKSNYKINIISEEDKEKEDNNNSEEIKNDIEKLHKINNTHLYIGIGSAISITITSIILIILINKRRKNKSKK